MDCRELWFRRNRPLAFIAAHTRRIRLGTGVIQLAAQGADFAASSIPMLLVEGDNRAGLGYALAKAVGDAGINMKFVMAQVVGRRHAA